MKRIILFGVVAYIGLFIAIVLAILSPWKAGESFAEKQRSTYLPRTDKEFREEEKDKAKEYWEWLERVK